jgi:hypothetical protein
MCGSDELHPYPIRGFTCRNEQVRVDKVQRVIVCNIMKFIWLIMSRKVNVSVVIRLQARQWRFGIQLSGGGDTALLMEAFYGGVNSWSMQG